MYEGKNIHYSPTDRKLLCSFSGKLCNQRRLNRYGFCVRHILEDPTAPFRRCAYVAKSSNQMCTQAIPNHEERRYCNNHMQVLGMLPKKERKKKDKPPNVVDQKIPSEINSGLAKTKFSLSNSKESNNFLVLKNAQAPTSTPGPDSDDPYAFSDGGPAEGKILAVSGAMGTTLSGVCSFSSESVLGKSLQSSGQGFVRSASDINSSGSGAASGSCLMAGGSIIAKFYPELAEKLESQKTKLKGPLEPKPSPKNSKGRTSRTMNKLQTKIAQNRINEKLRKSQELSGYTYGDLNSSPLQMSSPEQSLSVEQSPSPGGGGFSPASTSSQAFSPQAGVTPQFHQQLLVSSSSSAPGLPSSILLPGYEQSGRSFMSHDIPPLPQVDTSFLATLAAQDNLGFHSGAGDDAPAASTEVSSLGLPGMTGLSAPSPSSLSPSSERLPHTPPRLPPPYPGSSGLSTPSSLTSADKSPVVSAAVNQPTVLSHNAVPSGQLQPVETTLAPPFTPPQQSTRHKIVHNHVPQSFLSPPSSSPLLSSTSKKNANYLFVSPPLSEGAAGQLPKSLQSNLHSPSLPTSSAGPAMPGGDVFSLLNLTPKQLGLDSSRSLTQQSLLIPSSNTMTAHLSLPPPPPYVPPSVPSKVSAPTHSLSTTPTISKIKAISSVQNMLSLPKISVEQTKLRKLRGILSEKSAKRKLKSELAAQYYSHYVKRKKENHYLVGPSLCSSDEDSENEGAEFLPWQRDVFSASSDEEEEDIPEDIDELGNSVPLGMRPTKLSLLKTQLRRQWSQGRMAARVNSRCRRAENEATLSLIKAARESGANAVRTLWQIKHVTKSKKKLKKKKKKFKICCHKNDKEGQCKNVCLPYANHCLKHITYNVDQQLFDFCTAKFASNIQCCLPSFDLRHELPLCLEHAAKADNYQRLLELENKKKPRKKSKPPALTRPTRKGKKKKKGRYSKTQQSMPPPQSIAFDSTLSDVDVTSVDPAKPEDEMEKDTPSASEILAATSSAESKISASTVEDSIVPNVTPNNDNRDKDINKNLDHPLELPDSLLPSDFDKPFGIPLDNATRLLEESDLQDVVNKMPFDALDLFGKAGEADHEHETSVALTGDLAPQHSSVGHNNMNTSDMTNTSRSKEVLEKLLSSMSEEESMQIALVLAQSLHSDPEMGGLNADMMSTGSNMAGLDSGEIGIGHSGINEVDAGLISSSSSGMRGFGSGAGDVQNATGLMGGLVTDNISGASSFNQTPSSALGTQARTEMVGGGVHSGSGSLSRAAPGNAEAAGPSQGQTVIGGMSSPDKQVARSASANYLTVEQQQRQQRLHLQQQHQLQLLQQQQQQQKRQVQIQRLQQLQQRQQLLQQQQQQQQHATLQTTTVPTCDTKSYRATQSDPVSVVTADLNTVYGQIERLNQFQMAAQQGLNHLPVQENLTSTAITTTSTMSSSIAKTVIRHLPTDSVSSSSPQTSQPLNQRTLTLVGQGDIVGSESNNGHSVPPNVCLQPQQSRIAVSSVGYQGKANVLSTSTLPSQPLSQQQQLSQVVGLRLEPTSTASAKLSKLNISPLQLQQLHVAQQSRTQPQTSVRYMLQPTSTASSLPSSPSASPAPVSSNSKAKLLLPDKGRPNADSVIRVASPNPIALSKFNSGGHRLSLNSSPTFPDNVAKVAPNFPSSKLTKTSDTAKLKLTSSGTKLLDSSLNRMSLSKSSSAPSATPPSFARASPKPAGVMKLLSGSASSTALSSPTSSPSPPSSHTSSATVSPAMISKATTMIRHHNLLSVPDSLSNNESISVTVRQPSPMESVPSTVRHTLPDVCPTPMTLPSSPALQLSGSLPMASHSQVPGMSSSLAPQVLASESSSPSRIVTLSPSPSPTPMKMTGRQQQLHLSSSPIHRALQMQQSTSSIASGNQLSVQQNGLQQYLTETTSTAATLAATTTTAASSVVGMLGIGSRAAEVVSKFQPNKTGKVKNKSSSTAAAAEAARLSALASAAGVPVVCNPVSLAGFAAASQGLPTSTVFKSSGSS